MYTLLFVDDELDIVASLQRTFRKDYRTLGATSGAEAIAIIDREAVDLIICDQRMSALSGDQVLTYALERQPEAIRILLTGYTDIEALVRCINEAQIYKYLTKPWEPQMLRLTVVRALENLETERQRQLATMALGRYVNSTVAAQIMDDPSRLQLGGERKTLTMLFSDVEGFSLIAERLEPELLTALINDYLSEMTAIVMEEGGTLDKYLGDAIVAFWNAPLDQSDHATRACRTALRCQRRLQERLADYQAQFGVTLKVRIGIHTGEVVVGNMGSRMRFDYSMIGDGANLTSRLENANKAFGTDIMVSDTTWNAVAAQFSGREIGVISVPGRIATVRVYELLGEPGAASGFDAAAYNKALALSRERQWAEAAALFDALADDPVACRYAAVCRQAQHSGGWDGVWQLESK